MRLIIFIFAIVVLYNCSSTDKGGHEFRDSYAVKYDSHVHLMSPGLVEYWKELGIPFSRSEANYTNIDTILSNNNAGHIDLIGMGYVYENPEYYQGEDADERMRAENDYLFECAAKYPHRITAFFAIDPLKEYAIDEIKRCVKLNANSGLKLHFSASQVYLTEPEHLHKTKTIFKRAAKHKLPILLHFDNWHPKFGEPDLNLMADSILADLDSINIQIAHFGTSGGFNDKTKRFIDAFVKIRNENRIPSRHTILFDISAVALDKDSEGVAKLTDEAFAELRMYVDKIGIENIVFGTDYPLYNSEDYFEILREKVGLNADELAEITQLRH